MEVNPHEEVIGESVDTTERIYNHNIGPRKITEPCSFQWYYGGHVRDQFKEYCMYTENMRFNPRCFSGQAFYISCTSNKFQTAIQAYTKKANLRTNEIATKVMTSLDLYLKQLVDVIVDTGASYTNTPFKYDFKRLLMKTVPPKLTCRSNDLKI